MESILIKIEDLIEEIETEDLSTGAILTLLKEVKDNIEEIMLNDNSGTLEWGDLD